MISKSVIRLLALLVLTLSVTALPNLVHADNQPSNGTTPATQWVPAGPSVTKIQFNFYDSDTSEYAAICAGQPIGCVPSIDLTDIPIAGSDLAATGAPCSPCAENDPRIWLTQATPQLGMLGIDFNHASTLWGITFCNGRDGVVAGVTQCFDGLGGAAITASCPNIVVAGHVGDCSYAARELRAGIASLVNCAIYVADDTPFIGPNAICMDNPTSPPTGALHSGNPFDANCAPKPTCAGNYTVDSVTNQLVPGPVPLGTNDILGNPAYNVLGACSWDTVLGCSSANLGSWHGAHQYYNDATNAFGTNIEKGNPVGNLGRDFCNAAQHFINAGLATGMNAACELTGESTQLTAPTYPVVLKGRASLGRANAWKGLSDSICRLIALGNSNCAPSASFYVQQIGLSTAHQQVFRTGCKNGPADGGNCATQGPNTPANTVTLGGSYTQSWDIYTGGLFFTGGPIPNDLWGVMDSSFQSNYCGGAPGAGRQGAPNEEPSGDSDYICNSTLDTWAEASQFDQTPAAAQAALQVAQDIAGNHTFYLPIWTPSVQYPYTKGWNGVSNALGVGTAQGNFFSLLNAWNANPAIAGPTIRWGQKDATAALNVFTATSVVEADLNTYIYDSLIAFNPFAPSSQIIGWMVNFYRLETHATQPAECPASYTNSRGTFSVGACIKFILRGDIPWHDILTGASGSPCATASCLGDHVVTVSDVKYSIAAFNATGSSSTANTIDVVGLNGTASGLAPQLPASAFSTVGGANGGGIAETFISLLHANSAYAINDYLTIPIIPQRLWSCQGNTTGTACTNVHKMPNGFLQPCLTLDTAACTTDPALAGGAQSDPVATNRYVGSSAFVCSNQDLTIGSGLVVGGGCTSSGTQSIPFNGQAVFRAFRKGANGLDSNFAYFRSNEKFLWFQWAAYSPATNGIAGQASVSDILSAVNSCKVSATGLGGVISYQACQHWNNVDSGLSCASTAGTCDGAAAGGHGSLPGNPGPITTQIQQWIGRGAWAFQPTTQLVSSLQQMQPTPQTLYADGSAEGNELIAAAPTSVSVTNSTTAQTTVSVSLSGGPDNNFLATPGSTIHQLNETVTCIAPTGITCTVNTPSLTQTSAAPSASTTVTIGAAIKSGTYTVIVRALSSPLPPVTQKITVTVS